MLRNRKNKIVDPFGETVIEMEEARSKIDIIKNAIAKITKEQTIIRVIINYYYYVLSTYFSFMYVLFSRKYNIVRTVFYYQSREYIFNKKSVIYVLDNGIFLDSINIPYESVVSFGSNKNVCTLQIFGSLNFTDSKLRIGICKNNIKIDIELEYESDIVNIIKENMYYHIKYNKVNKDIVEFYNV